MAYAKYNVYLWTPPILTPEQEIEAGREIVMTGGAAVWKRKAPYLTGSEKKNVEEALDASANASPLRVALGLALFGIVTIGFIAAVVAIVPIAGVAFGIAAATILPLSIGSLLHARRLYHKWIDDMIEAYARDIEKIPPNLRG